ncbi:hypothetical protein DUNSADRAFT_18472 [Dunaliella salina]|uniref:Uncharacterized protein n=1 Tax=Dunaliella salina TaxID=3046 RepID=A0ABQ7G006_DUNSA|nr:hypothetical protein DUNSADRAFT_18472 [Dunaliella salina]|eukprot:KAF5827939.1 hypothetical protein DUNSADRAFT_18472 [Dunaliella salina]
MSDSQSDDGFTLVEGREGESEGAIDELGLLSATQQQEDAASINKFLELNVFPCEEPPPQAPTSPQQQHHPSRPTSCPGTSRESSPDKARDLSPAAVSPTACQPPQVSTPNQTVAPAPPSTQLASPPASEAPPLADPQSPRGCSVCTHPATNSQDPNTAPPGPSFSSAWLWPSAFLLSNLLVGVLAGVNANWCYWAMGSLVALHAVGLVSWLWPVHKPHSSTARPATSRPPTSRSEPSKDKVWMLSFYIVMSTLLAVIVFWTVSLAGALWWHEVFVQPQATTPSQSQSQPSQSHALHPPPSPEKGSAYWSRTTQQSGAWSEQAADAQLSKYVKHLHQQLALKEKEIKEQRHIISSIFSSQPPSKLSLLRAKAQTGFLSPEEAQEAAEVEAQECYGPFSTPPPPLHSLLPLHTPPPAPHAPLHAPSDEQPGPSTHGPDPSNKPAHTADDSFKATDQQQGAASAALVPQDLEKAKQAQLGMLGRMHSSTHALALRQHSSDLVASAALKARGAAVALQRRGAAAAHGTAEIAAAVRRAATAHAVALRQQGASLLNTAKDKAAAAKGASHAAALQVWNAGSNTSLGKRAGACGLAVYDHAEKFVERVVAAVRAFRKMMRDTRSAVIAARRKMQSRAFEHAHAVYGQIKATVSGAKQRAAGWTLVGKAAQQQPQQQQQQQQQQAKQAQQAQQPQEQAAEAAGRGPEGGMLRGRLQQLVRRLPNLRRQQA